MLKRYAPGCALMIYKPHLARRVHEVLREQIGPMDRLLTCCRNEPLLEPDTEVINICPGCDRRYRQNYSASTTTSLWEILAEGNGFPFPDYRGRRMSIIDACPTRDQDRVHDAVRFLVKKMNIELIEPEHTRRKSICCGDSFWGEVPIAKVHAQMRMRTSQMPVEDVIVYCVSCTKSVFHGGKHPRYLIDLLFGEDTVPQTLDIDAWHAEVDAFKEGH